MVENPFKARKIGCFSLSRAVNEERLSYAVAQLNEWNVKSSIPRTSGVLRYLNGSDKERLDLFHALLEDESLDMLVALCGGFGVTRILDDIDWKLMRQRNMPIVGYSDVSALHLAAYKHGCCNHIHGPMLLSNLGVAPNDTEGRKNLEETMSSLAACLAGNPCPLLPNTELSSLKEGQATAPIVPCNLSMLISLLGTPHFPSLKNTILAIEDVGEAAYRVDRMLAQLKSAGVLKSLKGLVFGDFTDCEDSEYLPEIFAEYAAYVPGPVVMGMPFGHGKRTMSIKVGAFITLTALGGDVTMEAAPLNRFEPMMYTAGNETMGYRLMRPVHEEPGKRYPLILFLHGAGERGEDNTAQLVHVLPKMAKLATEGRLPVFVAAPQCAAMKQWVDTPWSLSSHTMPENMSHQMKLAMALLESLIETLPIEPSRIYVMGISMGGYGTWDVIQRFPERFAAAVPICGGGDAKLAGRIADIPIWAFHGELDNLVPVNRTKDMVAAMEMSGGHPRMTIYPQVYHDSWNYAVEEPELWDWLLNQ